MARKNRSTSTDHEKSHNQQCNQCYYFFGMYLAHYNSSCNVTIDFYNYLLYYWG